MPSRLRAYTRLLVLGRPQKPLSHEHGPQVLARGLQEAGTLTHLLAVCRAVAVGARWHALGPCAGLVGPWHVGWQTGRLLGLFWRAPAGLPWGPAHFQSSVPL